MTQSAKDLTMSRKIAQAVRDSGGRAFFVGGYVRDKILGHDSKDIDIEIHGLTESRLTEILGTLGEVLTMGASFGILGLRHYTLDIVMPRSLATGEVDPFTGTREAARRRDFTMNALMQDVLTGEILDHFGGVGDIHSGVIRHVDGGTFLLDALRVVRAARFAAVLGFTVDADTRRVCSSADTSHLAPERVFAELGTVLTKSPMPSRFFTELEGMRQISAWFPEIQSADTHILDMAASVREKSSDMAGFMLALLCHSLPQSQTARLLSRLTNDSHITRYVLNMSTLADVVAGMNDNTPELSFMRMFDDAESPDDLSLMSGILTGDSHSDILRLYHERMSLPCVTGADILREGVSPGPAVGEALRHVHVMRLEGVPKAVQLREAIRYIKLHQEEKS
ncbi:MAG: CCA tRNA nucleotidyltransferase [Synergistaceae bacterium]|nr:CCA tRNA nucleotidyltransferase [Synergistaceae bacterium]